MADKTTLRLATTLVIFLFVSTAPAPRGIAAEPAGRAESGIEERVRSENWNNARDFSDATDDLVHQLRFRTRAWNQFSFGSTVQVMTMINNESRKIFTPDTPFRWDELIVEQLYLDCKFAERWSIRFGRQNLTKGEGFIFFDGGPLDGSRTQYFNALDIAVDLGESKLEVIGISDPRTDEYMPVYNDRNRPLIEWNETAVGVYVTNKAIEKTSFDGYSFYKTETNDVRGPGNSAYQPDRRLLTLGTRVASEFGTGWSAAGEFAWQWGWQQPDTLINALGGYLYARKVFGASYRPAVTFGYVGMSGDDPATLGTNEGWDPLFSRWPKWSEMYIYSQVPERGAAYWTNLGMWQAEFTVSPLKRLGLRATYYWMDAFRPFPGDATIFGRGKHRGDMVQFRGDFTLPLGFKGHVLYERLLPGDFYVGGDDAWFFRVEVTYSFKHSTTF
jgi:hypothetical protein